MRSMKSKTKMLERRPGQAEAVEKTEVAVSYIIIVSPGSIRNANRTPLIIQVYGEE